MTALPKFCLMAVPRCDASQFHLVSKGIPRRNTHKLTFPPVKLGAASLRIAAPLSSVYGKFQSNLKFTMNRVRHAGL